MRHGLRIRTKERIRQNHILAVRMTSGIEFGIAIEALCFDDQRVSVVAAGGNPIPALWNILRPLHWVHRCNRNKGKPGVLFPKYSQRVVAVDELRAVWRIHVSRHSEWQAAAGVVSILHR